jgi:hypothetical protein
MKKLIFCLLACLVFAGCAENCRPCKFNADQDKAKAEAQKAFSNLDSQKAK